MRLRPAPLGGLLLSALLLTRLPLSASETDADETAEGTAHGDRGGFALAASRGRLPSDEVLEAAGVHIGTIQIRNESIFDLDDPAENRRLFRLANRLHPETRPEVVREQLLFHEGDPYSPELLAESERLIRTNPFLFDAWIRPLRVHDDLVDVEVRTRDVWTLSAGFSFRREGGQNVVEYSVSDSNFLGFGKGIEVSHRIDVDRTSTALSYRDSNVFGSRVQLNAAWAEADDGATQSLDVGRPFYSMDSRWAARLRYLADERVDHLYGRGEVVGSFVHDEQVFEVSGGLSAGLREGFARRLRFGATLQRDRFSPDPDPEVATVPILPDDRLFVYPWIGFELVEDEFEEMSNLDLIQRTEDRFLGRNVSFRLGWSPDAWTGEGSALLYQGAYRDTLWSGRRGLLQAQGQLAGRWAHGGVENLLASGTATFYHRDLGNHLFFVRLAGDFADSLDRDRQLLIGGDSGLRGYPLRYQEGDRRVLLTLEQRFFTKWEPFRLFLVGAAAFYDIGRAWRTEEVTDAGSGFLQDVGVGLRIGSSRSSRARMVHLDVAFPLDGDPSIRGVQWLVRTHETF